MNTELAVKPVKQSALMLMASRLNVEPEKLLKTLKDTVFKNATDSELLALVVVSNEYGLNPLLREIYAFPAKGGGITPVVSIDGWISMVNRQPQLDGLSFQMQEANGKPTSCTCTIYVKGRNHPVIVTEYYEECFRATEPWQKMPRRMLRHKSLKEAARVAFGFSGITDEDEANDIKPANARLVSRAITPPTFSDAAPEITEQEGGETEVAPSGESKAAELGETPVPGGPSSLRDSEAEGPGEPPHFVPHPPFVAETPQEQIALALMDMDIKQTWFVEGLKRLYPTDVAKKAVTCADLSDQFASELLGKGLDPVIEKIQGGGK